MVSWFYKIYEILLNKLLIPVCYEAARSLLRDKPSPRFQLKINDSPLQMKISVYGNYP